MRPSAVQLAAGLHHQRDVDAEGRTIGGIAVATIAARLPERRLPERRVPEVVQTLRAQAEAITARLSVLAQARPARPKADG